MPPIRTLLVANRGEIARRVFRTAREMGIRTVAVYSTPDARAPFVAEADVAIPLGGTISAESYLDVAKVLGAARLAGADAIHPGYGFLSENPDFAEACAAAGIVFVGPSATAIRAMARKVEAKALVGAAGVPLLLGATLTGDDPDEWRAVVDGVGYPVLVKASSGGGGKGMRRVDRAEDLADAVLAARREAQSSFGDPTVFAERCLVAPRHVEVQVFGDTHGNVVHLGERECSIQRRHQKIVEEAPSPGVSRALRERLLDAAVAAARAIDYVGAGTVEFLAAGDEAYFLEMNTRLQVEHPVTEAVTGLDLVRLQLLVASGAPLPFAQDEVRFDGHAIEVRLYAEDPANGYLPSTGRIERFAPGPTPGVRWDSGIETGSVVSPHYDPMLAKVITHAGTRDEAAARLARALDELAIHGVTTNVASLAAILRDPDFLAGDTTTDFLDVRGHLLVDGPPRAARRRHAVAAMIVERSRRLATRQHLAFVNGGWRNVASQRQHVVLGDGDDDVTLDYAIGRDGSVAVTVTDADGVEEFEGCVVSLADEVVVVELDGAAIRAAVHLVGDRWWVNDAAGQSAFVERPRFVDHSLEGRASGPIAPVPGTVVAVAVAVGDEVVAGQLLVVLEAMKMEHRIEAAAAGTVAEVRVAVGDAVDAHEVLVVLDDHAE